MIVPDVNLLLYAHINAYPEHAAAKKWWTDALAGREVIGLSYPVAFGFVRISTNLRVFKIPLRVEESVAHVEAWLAQPQVELLQPGPRHLAIAFGLLRGVGTAAHLTADAQLAAIAIENQAELHSSDTDFGRFSGLRWVNPLKRK